MTPSPNCVPFPWDKAPLIRLRPRRVLTEVQYLLQQRHPVNCSYSIYIIKDDMFVCLFVCIYVPYGRPNGWADRHQTWHTHSCPPRECFCLGQCQGHSCVRAGVTEVRNTRNALPGERYANYVWRTNAYATYGITTVSRQGEAPQAPSSERRRRE